MAAIKRHRTITIVVLVIAGILILTFFNPIHFVNLNLLKLQFMQVQKIQLPGTDLIWRKSYIGGLGSDGNGDCNYMIGELHSFIGQREKVVEQYKKFLSDNVDAGILFMDGDKWPLDSILWDWRGNFLDENNIERGKYYIIYISQKFPALLDTRCKV